MAEKKIILNRFSGGISTIGNKIGQEHSAKTIKNLNIHEDPSYITLSPSGAKVSGSTVLSIPQWMVDCKPFSTDKYVYDGVGNIYKVTSAETWTLDRATATIGNNATGQGMQVLDDFLYYATGTTIGRKGYLSGTPAYNDDFLSDGTTNLDQSLDTSGNTYTLTTGINEGATHRQTFVPTKDPIKYIAVLVASRGTGNWTLTVHDSNNVSIGSDTVANASLTNSTDNNFTFYTTLRVTTGNSYHFHLTSTVADGTVTTTTASDLETVDYHEYFGILVDETDWHSMALFLNQLVVCNERYLATWDQATYSPNALKFAPGWRARTLTVLDEYLVIGCWKASKPIGRVDDSDVGRLYFWDGISTTFNFFKEINLGSPNAIHTSENKLVGVYGSEGVLYEGTDPFMKRISFQSLTRGKLLEVFPGGITEWQGRTLIAYSCTASAIDDTSFVKGVYEYGSDSSELPEALTLAHTISTGETTGSGVKISMVKAFGKNLYIGWQSTGGVYGMDKIVKDNGSTTSTGSWESLLFDDNNPNKTKLAIKLVIQFRPLTSGQSVTPKYRRDIVNPSATTFTSGDTVTTVGATRAELSYSSADARWKEMEFGFDVSASGGDFPIITSVMFMYDSLEEEYDES